MALRDIFTDPSSQQLSMSRVTFGLLVAMVIVVSAGLIFIHKIGEMVDLLKAALITNAGIYGANSVSGVVARKGLAPAEAAPAEELPAALSQVPTGIDVIPLKAKKAS